MTFPEIILNPQKRFRSRRERNRFWGFKLNRTHIWAIALFKYCGTVSCASWGAERQGKLVSLKIIARLRSATPSSEGWRIP